MTLAAKAAFLADMLLPPFLFLSVAAALARSSAMTDATRTLLAASERLFAADETAANNAARLARAVRRELDGLNTGLDGAFQRMRAMEAVLEKQISALDEAGARAASARRNHCRAPEPGKRAASKRWAIISPKLPAAPAKPWRAAPRNCKATMETAEGALKMAAQSLDVQAAGFRAAVTSGRRCAAGGRQVDWKPRPSAFRTCPMPPWRARNSCWRGRKSIAPR